MLQRVAADPDERRAPGLHSLGEITLRFLRDVIEFPRRGSNPQLIDEAPSRCGRSMVRIRAHAMALKSSPRTSTAQARRAFLAAIATTAFQ